MYCRNFTKKEQNKNQTVGILTKLGLAMKETALGRDLHLSLRRPTAEIRFENVFLATTPIHPSLTYQNELF